ncbi:unnamed protein product [Pylaiella littoralis]
MFTRAIATIVALLAATIQAAELSLNQEEVVPRSAAAGILFFGYGADDATAGYYLRQATVSARRIKELNPSANITVVCNPGVTPEGMKGAFDMVINIKETSLHSGKRQSWGPKGVTRQWLTRLEYLSRSPYEVTLALDSQALCCSNHIDEIFDTSRWPEFDVAFAVQGPKRLEPHNWAILYKHNANTQRLLKRWHNLQKDYDRNGSDQPTLYMAAGSLALQGKLNVGVLSQNVALATVIYSRHVRPYPKTSRLVDPRPVYFIHYDALSHEDEEETCKKVNADADRARVVLLPRQFPKSPYTHLRTENIYEMVFSEKELETAVTAAHKDAPFFEGLDWDNEDKTWGQVATPWKEHYPNCWEVLAKDVNAGIRHIYRDPSDLWDVPRFAEEFANDTLDWTAES